MAEVELLELYRGATGVAWENSAGPPRLAVGVMLRHDEDFKKLRDAISDQLREQYASLTRTDGSYCHQRWKEVQAKVSWAVL